MAVRRMRTACWIPKATNTHTVRLCKTHCFPLQQRLNERASILRFTYTARVVDTVLNCSENKSWVCLNCTELHKICWRQEAGTHSAEARSPASVSFLYLRHVTYADFPKFLNLPALHNRRLHLDALFFISVCPAGLIYWPSVLDITGIRVLPRNLRNSSLFTATSKISPSSRRVSATNHLCNDVRILSKPIDS